MFNRLVNFLDKHNILDDNQFGFRSGCSTAQASMLTTDKIQRAIGNKLYSCGIFLDLSKAFDTVDRLFTVSYFFVRGGGGGEKNIGTVITSLELAFTERVVPATQAFDWSLDNRY